MFSLLAVKQAFLDAQGNPLSNGRLWTKVSGSNTNKATFKDADGLVPNTNPIILDSRGEVPFGVYGTTGVYRLILAAAGDLTDPPTSPIWGPRDGVSGINDFVPSGGLAEEWNPTGFTPTFVSSTSFSVTGDQTGIFEPRRRVRATISGGGSRYGTIQSSTFVTVTTVVLVNDLTAIGLDASLTAVAVGKTSATNTSQPYDSSRGVDMASAGTLTLPANADRFNITGTTTITELANSWTGRRVYLSHAGVQAITHSATLVLPGSLSFTTGAGDETVWEQTNGTPPVTWKMINHMSAGTPLGGLRLINRQVFTVSGNWTKPNGTRAVLAMVQAGGGGAGGAGANSPGVSSSMGSGGGGGGYGERLITSGLLATEGIQVGLGGAGGDVDGAIGGNSAFGVHVTASGGTRGNGSVASTATGVVEFGGSGGIGGAPGGFVIAGSDGGLSFRSSPLIGWSGDGGGSNMAGRTSPSVVDTNGLPGKLYGGGGSGANATQNIGRFGGNGAAGIVIVDSYG